MTAIEFDQSRVPLSVITYRGLASTVEFDAFIARVDGWLGERQTYALVFDVSRADVPTAVQRRRLAEWTASRRQELTRFCLGTAFVITTPSIRGAFTAVLWLQPLPYPHEVVASRQEGEAWCRKQLDARSSSTKSA